ncbi:MAG: PPA1309 family protein [Aeromicrobium sp.]
MDDPLPSTPLRLVALEIEAHVAADGWDQPPRLYALVPTTELVEREPALAERLATQLESQPDALTPIEQEGLAPDRPLEEVLGEITWPDTVAGCAAVVERVMLPPEAEEDLPTDADELMLYVADHPDRREVRLVAAVTRDAARHSAVRGREPVDAPLLEGPDLVPGLLDHLIRTLR